MQGAARGDSGWAATARATYLVAMAIFLVTIAIGVLNGLDLVEFDHNQLLTHVHSGTIGWLTMSIVATTFLAYRAADARLAIALAVLVPVYVAAFYTGSFVLRAVTGLALFAAIAWLVAWAWIAWSRTERTLARLGLTLALSMFALGAVVGVLLQVGFAAGTSIVPGDGIGAHAGAMTFGYLVLAAMAVQEWRVLGGTGLPRGGVIQLAALATGGLVIVLALLSGQGQVGGMVYLLAELVAVVLFLVRIVPSAVRIDWLAVSAARHMGAAAIWIVIALGIFMVLVAQFVAAGGDPSSLNPGILVASDHSTYIGVITNTTFALLIVLLGDRAGSVIARQVAFWGVNLALAVFVVGLITGTELLKQIGAPLMGLGLLVALADFGAGLWASRVDAPPDALAGGA